jgi:hypothetical protein
LVGSPPEIGWFGADRYRFVQSIVIELQCSALCWHQRTSEVDAQPNDQSVIIRLWLETIGADLGIGDPIPGQGNIEVKVLRDVEG